MMNSPALVALGEERFVSLTTYRKTGEAVSSPVWIVRNGDALVVTTPEASGKVKRLRNSPRVVLRPCDRMGRVKESAQPISARAEILTGQGVINDLQLIFRTKYRLEYRIFMLIERLGKQGAKERVMLRITSA